MMAWLTSGGIRARQGSKLVIDPELDEIDALAGLRIDGGSCFRGVATGYSSLGTPAV